MKRVRIEIRGGKVSADFEGFYGTECKQLEERIKPESVHIDNVEDKPELNIETESNTISLEQQESDYF
ncbi:hypothetical protein NRC85_003755 [Vibrio parahaemolyticus]|nr:hypothetical protein [Vibrio parahaemolyticus]